MMFWPSHDKRALKLSIRQVPSELRSLAGQGTFVSDVIIENLTDKTVSRIYFNVYVNDKANVRIGDGVLTVNDVRPLNQ